MNVATISLLIADDHPLILAGIASLFEGEVGFSLIGQASTAQQTVEQYLHLRPDVLLIDLDMPGSGLKAIKQIRALDPDAKIVILTAFEGEENVYQGMHAGAVGYLLKQSDFSEIASCIKQVMFHGRYLPPRLAEKIAARIHSSELSKRELEILVYLSAGKSNKQIAREEQIGVGTVKYHVNNIFSKLQVTCRTEAAYVAKQRGIISEF